MKDLEFKSLDELYNRLKPAMESKVTELKLKHMNYIKVTDVWNYLSSNVWKNGQDLDLNSMVSDILNLDEEKLSAYVLKILEKSDRKIDMDEGNLL